MIEDASENERPDSPTGTETSLDAIRGIDLGFVAGAIGHFDSHFHGRENP
jgi:hypothetical protein